MPREAGRRTRHPLDGGPGRLPGGSPSLLRHGYIWGLDEGPEKNGEGARSRKQLLSARYWDRLEVLGRSEVCQRVPKHKSMGRSLTFLWTWRLAFQRDPYSTVWMQSQPHRCRSYTPEPTFPPPAPPVYLPTHCLAHHRQPPSGSVLDIFLYVPALSNQQSLAW